MDEVLQSCELGIDDLMLSQQVLDDMGFIYVAGEVGVSLVQLCPQFRERSIFQGRGF